MKKFGVIFFAIFLFIFSALPARADSVSDLVATMSTKEKIAQMIIPAFDWKCETSATCETAEMESILGDYNFAGIILRTSNYVDTEQTVRLIDAIQTANASRNFNSQLIIATDQEGGIVYRLKNSTIMPGNMALGATTDPSLAKTAAETIGKELAAVGINTDFAPVADVNNNPSNPVIGVRSFSDDPNTVATFASSFMSGLKSSNIMTSLKHFPGHGDTSTDTHSSMTVVDKSYAELKSLELVPFQKLINDGTDMIMTAHIQYPQIETETYTSIKDGSTITLPATLSKKVITDILRGDMGYNGVVVTDALDMGAIADHFAPIDAAKFAINAGVDILLMPASTVSSLRTYIDDVAALVENGTIDSAKVDAAVTRVLTMKKNHGLLENYSINLSEKIANAENVVSTKESHDLEFEIAKKAFTLVKNENETLPLSADDKTMILYYYDTQRNSAKYAVSRLLSDGVISTDANISYYEYDAESDAVKADLENFDNIVIFGTLYGIDDLTGTLAQEIDEYIALANEKGKKIVFLSTQLPYDLARYNDVDAKAAVYLASGLRFSGLETMTKNIPLYGPNVIAGVYQLFNENAEISGKLPVNIYKIDDSFNFTSEIVYSRGFGLKYGSETPVETPEETPSETETETETVKAPNSGVAPKTFANDSATETNLFVFVLVLSTSILVIYRRKITR